MCILTSLFLEACEEYKYLLIMIDRDTRWIEVVPLRQITAEEVANTVYTN